MLGELHTGQQRVHEPHDTSLNNCNSGKPYTMTPKISLLSNDDDGDDDDDDLMLLNPEENYICRKTPQNGIWHAW